MMKVALLLMLIAAPCLGTEAFQPNWKSIVLVSNGPVSAGEISVEANIDSFGMLDLKVKSNFGEFHAAEPVANPHLNTITITRYPDGIELEQFEKYFVVCLFVGDMKRVDWGSRERPRYEWSYDLAVYTFTPGKYKFEIQGYDGTLHIADCVP